MQKKVYRSLLSLAILSIVLTALISSSVFYKFFENQIKNEIKKETLFIKEGLSSQSNLENLSLPDKDTRISLIDTNGKVLFDNFEDISSMDNHLNRPEINNAIKNSNSEEIRYSDTLSKRTYYYAVKLSDNKVLRLAKTTDNIYKLFLNVLIVILIISILGIVICRIFASRLTKKIMAPINDIDLTKDQDIIYDEIAPFLSMIEKQKKRIHEQFVDLEERANTIRIITQNMKEGLLIIDSNGEVLVANNSLLNLFNIKSNGAVGKNILEVIRDVKLQSGVKKALNNESSDIIIEVEGRILNVFFNPVIQNAYINGVITLFLDITDKANSEKIRREFSANVSHELKTPLTTISGYAEMINSDMVKPIDVKTFSKIIRNESSRLISLIEDIIKLSEIDEGINSEDKVLFDIKGVALEAVQSLDSKAKEKNILVEVVGDKKIVSANNKMIFELFYNIIENAIKYNKVNGKLLISLNSTNSNSKTKIEFIDTGIGIDKKELDRIFERFYRVDKSRSKKTGGTGLGLSIVKHIVEYHNGSIDVESVKGEGTRFIVEI